jgi:predicted membrane GTPase involved in stress response
VLILLAGKLTTKNGKIYAKLVAGTENKRNDLEIIKKEKKTLKNISHLEMRCIL